MLKKFKPGVSFSDFVVQDFSATKSKVRDDERRDFRRGWLLWVAMVIALVVIGVRLTVVQVIHGGTYQVLADENRIKQVKIRAERGKILDRNGVALTGTALAEASGSGRVYPLGPVMAHVLGYVSEVGEDEVGLLKAAGKKYAPGDWVGRMGLEQAFEKSLRGMDGGRVVEVDNTGKVVREMGVKAPVAGQDLQTTLDAGLSQTAYAALKGKKGAVVASNPQTGEIYVLVSSPGFEPNLFANPKSETLNPKQIQNVLTDPDLPMFNRAISGAYPPGSTFKMVTTAAAIDSGKVKPDFTFEDMGAMTVAGFRYTNWLFTKRGATEGVVGFVRALTRSTDTFYYKVGELIGPETIGEWAKRFGFGEESGVEIAGEVPGVIASPVWKLKAVGEKWFLGNTYHLAIGQGDMLTTPLQVNLMTNVFATNGKKCKPLLVGITPSNPPLEPRGVDQEEQCSQVPVSEKTLQIVHAGMIGACTSGGTAFPLFDWDDAASQKLGVSAYAKATTDSSLPLVACKTGTAEYVAENGKVRTHAWLTAYAPADKPTISVTALLEGGGEGSNAAAPVVRQVMAKYFGVTDTYPYDKIPQEVGE